MTSNDNLNYNNLDFDNTLLVPIPSQVNSRDDVDLSVDFSLFKLDIPIIASPMKGIVGPDLIIGLSKFGGIGILHRFYMDKHSYFNDLSRIRAEARVWGAAVGVNDDNDFIKSVLEYGPSILCIDTANGYLNKVLDKVSNVKDIILKHEYKTLLMSGNVVTPIGASNLFRSGCDIIRVGIGTGNLCTTRIVTGVGYPQISALLQCSRTSKIDVAGKGDHSLYYIVSDGGIRNSGDVVKALAAGADAVMIGTLFSKTYESENNGIIYGMASSRLQEEYYHSVKSIEGREELVEKEMYLSEFLSTFLYGIKSAFTYLNSFCIRDLRYNSTFIKL